MLTRGKVIAIVIGVVIFVMLICVAIAAPSRQRTQSNEWGCSFGDGPVERSRALKGRLAPGESHGYSNDKLITGPSDIRFFYVDNDPATADYGTRAIEVPARGSAVEGVGVVPVSAEVQVRFVINENFCGLYVGNLKRIDERVDLNYNAKQGEESGWGEFLTLSMNQKLIEATRPVLRDVDYITLYRNDKITVKPVDDPVTTDHDESEDPAVTGSAYDVLAKQLSEGLSAQLFSDLGGVYFCGPSYRYDGTDDGKLQGGGCPALEVTVKSITPTNTTLIDNLTAIVTNEEQQRKLESDTALANKTAAEQASRAVEAAKQTQRQSEQDAISRQATEIANANANKEIEVNQALADQATKVAQASAQQEIELAQETRRRSVEEAKAATDLSVALQRAPVATQLAENKKADQHAAAQFCIDLAAVNIRCDLLASAEAGGNIVPNINLSGSADGGTAATVVLDARP